MKSQGEGTLNKSHTMSKGWSHVWVPMATPSEVAGFVSSLEFVEYLLRLKPWRYCVHKNIHNVLVTKSEGNSREALTP